MIMVTGWPSWCLLLKVHSFHNENIRRRWTYQRMAKEDKISFSQNRRRQSIFRTTEMERSTAAQAKAVPPWLKKIIMVFTMAVGVFFLATGIVPIVASPKNVTLGCGIIVPLRRRFVTLKYLATALF